MQFKLKGHALKRNQKILVTRSQNDPVIFISSIENVTPKGLTITIPLHNQIQMPLEQNQEIFLQVESSSAVLGFKCQVQSFTMDNIVLVNLTMPTDFNRIQRRKSFRLEVLLPVKITLFEDSLDQVPVNYNGTALDISATGMELNTSTKFTKGESLFVDFQLELDDETIFRFHLLSKICRISQDNHNYKLGLQFISISDHDADNIIRYIFKKSTQRRYWD